MIDKFSMLKHVLPRLEKHMFDRVWNEPYSEYRTNTRPRILNGTVAAATGTVYTPSAGVLVSEREQIQLPSDSQYYVYSLDREQFRPVKLNATSWIALSDYCNKNIVDLRMFSDSGIFLWRGGIYISQDNLADTILVAVDAAMLHRCLDVYQIQANGDKILVKIADPSDIYFSKYCDSDSTDGVLNPADNLVGCYTVTSDIYKLAHRSNVDPILDNKYGTAKGPCVAYINGHAVVPGGTYVSSLLQGDYIEEVYDADIIYNTRIDCSGKSAPIYLSSTNKERMLFHVPRDINPDSYLITYNTCDFYLIARELTDAKLEGGYVTANAGAMVHMCNREDNFHQLTFNDMSIDMEVLDSVARENGFKLFTPVSVGSEAAYNQAKAEHGRLYTDMLGTVANVYSQGMLYYKRVGYYVQFVVRHHAKKKGLVRDVNYCDLLYSYSHNDDNIVKFLLNDAAQHGRTPLSPEGHGLRFWSAAYLEEHGTYASEMMRRLGPSNPNTTKCYYRTTVDKTYKNGKWYGRVNVPPENDVRSPDAVTYVPVNNHTSPVKEGVVLMSPVFEADQLTPEVANGEVDPNKNDGILERVVYRGVTATCDGTDNNQCDHCSLYAACKIPRTTVGTQGKYRLLGYMCPWFCNHSLQYYIKALGYYHTLSLICKKITTYRITGTSRNNLISLTPTGETYSPSEPVYKPNYQNGVDTPLIKTPCRVEVNPKPEFAVVTPEYESVLHTFPVNVPLALQDLTTSEWYAMVYVNGKKLADDKVTIGTELSRGNLAGLEEVHWTYTPGFGEGVLFESDQMMLDINVDADVEIHHNDYVTIELIPRISEEATDAVMYAQSQFAIDAEVDSEYSLTEDTKYKSDKTYYQETEGSDGELMYTALVAGTDYNVDDDIGEDVYDADKARRAYDALGSNINAVGDQGIKRRQSELVFLNGSQLVSGIDYMEFIAYTPNESDIIVPTIQNMSYLNNEVNSNLLEAIMSDDVVIGTAKGFIIGNAIEWDGVAPFWFDNLSLLTVGGSVVVDFEYQYSKLQLGATSHDNGEPYMVRTAVPKQVLDLVAPDINDVNYQTQDATRLINLARYFENIVPHLSYRALIPYEHKVYSTYLLAIIKDFINGDIDFDITNEDGSLMTREEFIAQPAFEPYESMKSYDVVYTEGYSNSHPDAAYHPGLSNDNLRFVDVYPIYHNVPVGDRLLRRKVSYLTEMMLDADTIRHREHMN